MAEHSILIRADDIPLVKFVRTMRRKVFKESPENAMFRAFQGTLDGTGRGKIDVSPNNEAVEWDIYQISVQTNSMRAASIAEIQHNGYFLCGTNSAQRDTAVGPPDLILRAVD